MSNDWGSYEKLVISSLDRLNDNVESINKILAEHHADLKVLTVKSTILGSIGGIAGGVITMLGYILIYWIKNSK